MRLIGLNNQEELKKAGIPFSRWTLYTWRKRRKNLEIFKKISNRVFIDLDAFENWVEKQNKKNKIIAGGK